MTQMQTNSNPYYILPKLDARIQTLVLLLIAFLLYSNTIKHNYAVDDKNVIQENEFTQKGWNGIIDHLTHDSFRGFYKDNQPRIGNYYRPLPLITFSIERAVLGNKPGFSHFINVILYTTLIGVLFQLFRRYIFKEQPEWAFLSILLFAIHPIHTEVVANIKSRDEILSLLFLSLSLLFAFRALEVKDKTPGQNILPLSIGAALFYLLALFSKENGLTFIAIFPLTLYFFSKSSARTIAGLSLILVLPLLIYFGMRVGVAGLALAQDQNIAVNANDIQYNRYMYVGMEERYATSIVVLARYISLLMFPHPLSWDYSYNQIPFYTFKEPIFWFALLAYIGLTTFALLGVKNRNPFAYATLYYLLSIFLVSNLLVNIGGYVGERFLFQPSLGFCMVVAGLLIVLPPKLFPTLATRFKPAVLGILVVIFTLACYKTYTRNLDWKNNETICLKDVEIVPNSAKANAAAGNTALGLAMEEQDTERKNTYYRLAARYLGKAVEVLPKWPEIYRDIGMVHALLKEFDTAEKYWRIGLTYAKDNPVLVSAYQYNLSTMYTERCAAAQVNNDFQAAIQFGIKATELSPQNDRAWNILGKSYFSLKDYEKATDCFLQSIQIQKDNPDYQYDLGATYFNRGMRIEAKATFERVLQLYPQHPGATAALKSL